MSLTPGTRVGPYEIAAQIGKGGMGEVYRARDSRLQRDVAIKVLPELLAGDADRMARFEREAQLLASVTHPHIAQIYGLEQSSSSTCIVMELVEGETLDERIGKGGASRPLPWEQAKPLALQIVDALSAAHERGVIHRDLKPANIKITPDGAIKLLDFGLAKLTAAPAGSLSSEPSLSPTITSPAMTAIGVLLGTAAYMSPEQAKGRVADKRSDIWAFGCVLFEMLTGTRAFEGDDVSDTLAGVLRGEPDWTRVPASTPPHIRKLLRRCLEKDGRKRLADIADARFELEEAAPAASAEPARTKRSAWTRALPFAAVAAVTGLLVGTVMWAMRPSVTPAHVLRFPIPVPTSISSYSALRSIAISPDGTLVAFAADGGLHVRNLSEADSKTIAGSESKVGYIGEPVFSPDGQSLAYWVGTGLNATLKRIAITGGTAVTLYNGAFPLGTSWNEHGIVFGQLGLDQSPRGLLIPPGGGAPQAIITLGDGDVVSSPQILPGGESVLFTLGRELKSIPDFQQARWDRARIVVQRIGSKEQRTVIEGGSDARYVRSGHLIYEVGSTVFAAPFDVARQELTGPAVPVLSDVARTAFGTSALGGTHLSVSDEGTIAYFPGVGLSAPTRLALLDRGSERSATLNVPPGQYQFPRVSPDGKQVAVVYGAEQGPNIWVYDLAGTTAIRQLTFGGKNTYPVWSHDGTRVTFQSDREGDLGIFWQRADGSAPAERLTKAEPSTAHIPASWSPDGKTLLFTLVTLGGTRGPTKSLWMLRDGKVEPFGGVVTNPVFSIASMFSPDGRWVAYTSTSTPDGGDLTIYVQPFPATGAKYRAGDGIHPLWSRDGTELFIINPGGLFAMKVTTAQGFTLGPPVPVPNSQYRVRPNEERDNDIMRDGRMLAVVDAPTKEQPTPTAPQIRVVVNWFEELKQLAPAK